MRQNVWLLTLFISFGLAYLRVLESLGLRLLKTPGAFSSEISDAYSLVQDSGHGTLLQRDTTFPGCNDKQEQDLSYFISRNAKKLRLARTAIDEAVLNDRAAETRFLRNFGGLSEKVSKVAGNWIDNVISSMSRRASTNIEVQCQTQDPRCRATVPDRDGNDSPMSGYTVVDGGKRIVLVSPLSTQACQNIIFTVCFSAQPIGHVPRGRARKSLIYSGCF